MISAPVLTRVISPLWLLKAQMIEHVKGNERACEVELSRWRGCTVELYASNMFPISVNVDGVPLTPTTPVRQ